jgi:hypothetical protein
MKNKENTTYEWDQRQQKLCITETRTVAINRHGAKGKSKAGQQNSNNVTTYDLQGTRNIMANMKQMKERMKVYIEETERLIKIKEHKEDLPMWKEITDVMAIMALDNDPKIMMTYQQNKPEYERIKKEIAEMEKVLPQFKRI